MLRRRMLLLSLLALVATACAGALEPRAGSTVAAERPAQDDPLQFDKGPFKGEGLEVPSLAQDPPLLSFEASQPKGLGTPKVFVSPRKVPADAVFFVYDSADYGEVWVGESVPDIPNEADRLAAYDEMVAANGQPNNYSIVQLVKIRDGITAITGHATWSAEAAIEWVEDGVQFYVRGDDLTTEDVIDIANSI